MCVCVRTNASPGTLKWISGGAVPQSATRGAHHKTSKVQDLKHFSNHFRCFFGPDCLGHQRLELGEAPPPPPTIQPWLEVEKREKRHFWSHHQWTLPETKPVLVGMCVSHPANRKQQDTKVWHLQNKSSIPLHTDREHAADQVEKLEHFKSVLSVLSQTETKPASLMAANRKSEL